ncbi:RNA--NAD 2'-phosphotransferase [Raoultella sp. Lac2]|uniref:RNA 2'-phosphotransferase n=1 Tax=Klebsiella/Raoultella group TaxID=2890311 RepID=UPI0011515CD0|nr:RNA 2'-phosphotransferase [Klebsiella electrica]MXF45566.1 RNA--NAD 2'-phosphotransferase [Raoultella sp. Lac2]MXF97020.1 RNA--NAD 2'-phosphotransferase [Raoultella sp. Lac1]QDI10140.1 RNA 2'-phosphotransferase [Klebsiella electrica]WIO44052.1 RNA 2'-phosphotransferase [Klebsiella electrica]
MSQKITETSKFLSYILRHNPDSIGLSLNIEGWVKIDSLIKHASTAGKCLDRDTILLIVESSDKKRFAISEDGQSIRAVQGHSNSNVNIAYASVIPPEFLYHGTAIQFIDSIKMQGLLSLTRQYVHLSADEKTALNVGKRHGKPIALKINALQMYQQGFIFHQADNGVWLTKNIPVQFIIE